MAEVIQQPGASVVPEPGAKHETADTGLGKGRHELLAELWGVTVEEARKRDEEHLAQVQADSEAADKAAEDAMAGVPAKAATAAPKKSDVAASQS